MQEWSFYWWIFKCALELNVTPYKNLHSTKLQKSKRRLLRNRRGVCFLKSWAAQRPRGSISEIEEAFAFSKARLRMDHKGRSQKSKRGLLSQKLGCFLKSWAAKKPRGPISEIEEAPTFPALSAPVTRTLSLKTSGEVEST